ncbi:MAG: phosphate acyltransferase [Solirubrobacterales bacterium]|nr:phosphate acyltransferase [Solirubrobacterales bacterium]
MVTVALDGRGVEKGPEVLAEGARLAMADGIALRVFGDPGELSQLAAAGAEIVEAPGEITNEDDPVSSVRSREDASIVMAAADVAEGRSQAVVSAGPTGATMTAALFALRRLSGVRRPSLAVQLPVVAHDGPPTLFLDAGANTEARSQDLVQSAVMGAAFSRAVLGVENPRVALLSVGEESKKGTADVVEAHAELAGLEGINFIGNIEGRDLLSGAAEVIATDGFTGNVALKTLEGTAKTVGTAVGSAARSNPISAVGGLMLRPALGGLRKKMDPDMTGGAILLGVRGVAVVGHGSSGPEGIANAIRLAARAVSQRSTERTAELLASAGATRGELK